MQNILNEILLLIQDASGYLKMFVAGAAGFFVLKDCTMYMISTEDHQKAASLRKIRTTLIAGACVFVVVEFVNWILTYFNK